MRAMAENSSMGSGCHFWRRSYQYLKWRSFNGRRARATPEWLRQRSRFRVSTNSPKEISFNMHRFNGQVLATALLASCALTSNAQELKIGDVIHLENKFAGGGQKHFLDTNGRIQDHIHKDLKTEHKWHVFTNNSNNRDKGSGSWEIGSAEGKKKGETLLIGDKITLHNKYPLDGGAYLDEGNAMEKDTYGQLFKRRGREQNDYPVFTANRADDPTEYWIVRGRNANVKSGTAVKAGEWIMLESAAHAGYFLRAGFIANEVPAYKQFNARCLVFTSTGHFGQGEHLWIPVPVQ
ncbi:MAG: hypothetical protein R2729_21140 [Bryobacteraceae bacterium]